MPTTESPLAIVTGASTGIGFELAKICAAKSMNLVIAADEPEIHTAATALRRNEVNITAVETDLSGTAGVDRLLERVGSRPVDYLIANAGRGLGQGFLDQDWAAVRHIIDTNVTGTLYLIQRVGQRMRDRGHGRILIVGSIAGFMPGTYQAVYNATKAFLDSFSFALRAEIADAGVSVTCLMPGETETEFFERADLMDTKIGQSKKQPADEVAKVGFDAMMRGDGEVVSGWQNKLKAAIAHVLPNDVLAEMHAKKTAPGSGR
jgi:short-subunit dehydrogenase